MTAAAPPRFYDDVLADPDALGLLPLERSPWLPLYQAVADVIPWSAKTVVDLGCGTGRLAALLGDTRDYIGIDFSRASIREAKRYATERHRARFRHADLRTCRIPRGDAYVTTEVLEHLDDDLGLLRRLRRGATVVLSVPSYNSAAHLRYFSTLGSALDRYAAVLDINTWRCVKLEQAPERFWHLITGRRA